MLNLCQIARIMQATGKPLGETGLSIDLAQQRQSGVGTHVGAVKPKQDRLAVEG